MSAADDESAVEMGDVQEVVEIVPLKSASDTVLSVLDDGRTITGASLASFDHESEDEWGEETSSIVAPAADIVEERSIEGAWLADAGSEHEDTGLDPVSLEPLPSELKPDEEGNYSAPDTACSEKSQ